MRKACLHLVVTLGEGATAVDLRGSLKEACRGGVDVVHFRASSPGECSTETHSVAELGRAVQAGGAVVAHRSATSQLSGTDAGQTMRHHTAWEVERCRADGLTLCSAGGVRRGASCHSVEEAAAAMQVLQPHGPDYLLVGTMYPTASHPGKVPESPQLLSAIQEKLRLTAAARMPLLVAIGGVTPDKIRELVRHGAGGVAVSSFVLDSADPFRAAKALKDELLAQLA
eukprot:Rhum_TRINITY_DN10498_c0_g2::Rhum_TRINITY_DN10498_c0_g2_i1::g.38685::m.38685